MDYTLIVEPRNPGNHVPQFQTKLHVPEKIPDGPRLALPFCTANQPQPSPLPHPRRLPYVGPLNEEEAPSIEGASFLGSSHQLTGVRSTTVFKCGAIGSAKWCHVLSGGATSVHI